MSQPEAERERERERVRESKRVQARERERERERADDETLAPQEGMKRSLFNERADDETLAPQRQRLPHTEREIVLEREREFIGNYSRTGGPGRRPQAHVPHRVSPYALSPHPVSLYLRGR